MKKFNMGGILSILTLLIIGLISWPKKLNQQDFTQATNNKSALQIPNNFFKESPIPGVAQGSPLKNNNVVTAAANPSMITPPDLNNGDSAIVLGTQLANPYTLANMQQAYNILYGTGVTLVANYKYVRFKPANVDELQILQDDETLELQDYPMDYTVVQDGDYYQDANLGTEDISWLYASVPIDYTPPSAIQFETLAQIYIPNEDLVLEGIAESIAAGAAYAVTIQDGNRIISRTDAVADNLIVPNTPVTNTPMCQDGYHWDFTLKQCVPNNCPDGYYWDNTLKQCVIIPPPPPPAPTLTGIYVQDIINCNVLPSTNVPLRQARVVCKRWFKIWRGYTDDLGQFNCTKHFRNSVKVIVKTKNNNATICKIRGVRFWQMLFPVTKRIGIFNGSYLPYIYYVFTKPANANATSTELPYWAAATTHNSVIEFKEYSTEFNLGQPKDNLKIFVTNWGDLRGTGSTVMFNKCSNNIVPAVFIAYFLAAQNYVSAGITTLATVLKNRIDMTISYLPNNGDYNCGLTSPHLKQIVYHELGHTQHYNQVGCQYWTAYRNAIITELTKLNQPDFRPYGTGDDATTAPIIATGEMWGNHCEYIYTNRRYGNGGTAANVFTAPMQGLEYGNTTIAGLTPYLAALESHNPHSTNDIWPWIPQGLPYDLIDSRNDNLTPIIDNVTGYTNQQCFNALQSDVRSVIGFRDRLLQQNNNNQQIQVTQLFNQYGY